MSPAAYALAADLVVLFHTLYVGFVVLGEGAILLGAAFGWQWIRNFAFRALHLLAIAVVAAEAVTGIVCPLTHWEARLRAAAGQPVDVDSFIGRWLHRILFIDAPDWAFTAAYCAFAALVVATLYWIPPRRRSRAA